ncbi:transposable element Tc1 transposase [Trichonephila clavipes]|nr:transposable element Tc1 transposase [Trichonephila clavipes]
MKAIDLGCESTVHQEDTRVKRQAPFSARLPKSASHCVRQIWDEMLAANKKESPSYDIIVRWEIGSRVGRNQTTLMWICDRWMQEGTTDRRGRSHPPQCTTSREDRQIVRMAVTDRSVTSRTVAQHIEFVAHHSVSARTIRRHLQQSCLSSRRPLLGLPLRQKHRRLRHQWCDERRMWAAEWNEVVFTDESGICLQHHDGRIRVWRHRGERMLNSCVMHRHTGPAPAIMSLATAIFQEDNARPHVARIVQRFFINHQIKLLPWPARSPDLSPIENMWSMVAQRFTQITPPAATPDQLWQRVEAAWSAVPQEHIQSLLESMPRRVAAVISNNGGYSTPHFTEVYKFNHLILGQHVTYKIIFFVLSLVFLGVAFTVTSSVVLTCSFQTINVEDNHLRTKCSRGSHPVRTKSYHSNDDE